MQNKYSSLRTPPLRFSGRLSRHSRLLALLHFLFDLLLLLLYPILLFNLFSDQLPFDGSIDSVYIVYFPALIYFLSRSRLYSSLRLRSSPSTLSRIISLAISCSLSLLISLYFARFDRPLPLSIFAVYSVLVLFQLFVTQYLVRFLLSSLRLSGSNTRSIISFGDTDLILYLRSLLSEKKYLGLNTLYHFTTKGPLSDDSCIELDSRFFTHEYDSLLSAADMFIIAESSSLHTTKLSELVNYLSSYAKPIHLLPVWLRQGMTVEPFEYLHSSPCVQLWSTHVPPRLSLSKRLFDIVFSLVLLILLSPLLLIISLSILLTSGGPVLFVQERAGLDGSRFWIYKFRTMHSSPATPSNQFLRQACKGDPRITPLGRYLRSTSLDELPQFFNVLLGHMSVVGPRPHELSHETYYRKLIPGYGFRSLSRPGITGLAQISGCRGATDTPDQMTKRIIVDLEYCSNWTFSRDLKIIAKTLVTVFRADAL